MAEGLASLVSQNLMKNILNGIIVRRKWIKVSDDTLLFVDSNTEIFLVLKSILRCFELALGLKVNFLKNKIRRVGVEHNDILRHVEMMNCNIMRIPFTYLGMPIYANPRKFRLGFMW